MDKPLIIPFPGGGQWSHTDVGGKGASLIRMCEAGFPVPAGAILSSTFFAPWFDSIKVTPTWAELVESASDRWTPLCEKIKQYASTLPLPASRMDTLHTLLRDLEIRDDATVFAVRSSAPEEDGTTSSFAGLYETRLGVRPNDLENAVRECFASCLDVRVLVYKHERGFDVQAPDLAVIVQRQIDSEVSGVGFSLNPVTNDYDEVVIDANWGLGTSVVEGRVAPDHFVINRFERRIVEETRGDKTISIVLDPNGGISERRNPRVAERTLSDEQLYELSDVIGRIETLFDTPVDVEWAYAAGTLHVLQARPIPTYVPLPPEMITPPAGRRRLYIDAALSKGMTMNRPISPLGLDNMNRAFTSIIESWTGPLRWDVTPEHALLVFAGGRMYMNLSDIIWLISPARMAKAGAATDSLSAEILAGIDAERYRSAERPSWAGMRLLWHIPRVLWRLRRFFWNVMYSFLCPERAHRWYQSKIGKLENQLRRSLDEPPSLDDILDRHGVIMFGDFFDTVMSVLFAGFISPDIALRCRTVDEITLADKLKRGIQGDVVVDMGIALYRMAKLLDPSEFNDLSRLADGIENREMSSEFLGAWDDFLAKFGCRGPQEMDPASPRYADDPLLALRQMSFMVGEDGFNPEAAHRRIAEERRQAYQELIRRLGPLRRLLLRRIYRLNELFAGARDTPKHLIVMANYAIRKRALMQGQVLTHEGRIDAVEDVFYLTLDELKAAAGDNTLDLRRICKERTEFCKKLDTHVTCFPPVIDSRGRIMRPPPGRDSPGKLHGTPVSPGVVTGRVKVLHTANEKQVEKGDVLVAYTTDPGWTPLFVNVAAIVLEVGGVLQHGAVVAREYGKPCVVGIDRVVTKLRDGELVEVDGSAGTVTFLQ